MRYLYLILCLALGAYSENGFAAAELDGQAFSVVGSPPTSVFSAAAEVDDAYIEAESCHLIKLWEKDDNPERNTLTTNAMDTNPARWNEANFLDVIEQILPRDAFGVADSVVSTPAAAITAPTKEPEEEGDDEEDDSEPPTKKKKLEEFESAKVEPINVRAVVEGMCECFTNRGKRSIPHIAAMRVVIDTVDKKRYIFPIPYIFASGKESYGDRENNAYMKWYNFVCKNTDAVFAPLRRGLDFKFHVVPDEEVDVTETTDDDIRAFDQVYQEEKGIGINNSGRNILSTVKCIGDYGYSTSSDQLYAHSERAAILCLLCDDEYSLKEIIRQLPGVVRQITVQIKTIEAVCRSCQDFLGGKAFVYITKTKKQFVGVDNKPNKPFNIYENMKMGEDSLPITIKAGREGKIVSFRPQDRGAPKKQ